MNELINHKREIERICLTNNVRSLFAFGSITTSQFKSDSDIDLVVDLGDDDPIQYADHYFNLKFYLEKLLVRNIDLLEKKAIKNPYLLDEIEKTKVLVYGK